MFTALVIGDERPNRLPEPAGDECRLLGLVEVRPQTTTRFKNLPQASQHNGRHDSQQNQCYQNFDERKAEMPVITTRQSPAREAASLFGRVAFWGAQGAAGTTGWS